MKFELRDYQKKCMEKILWAKNANLEGNDLVILPTGSGKSVLIAELANVLNEPILVLQPTKEILEQNYEKLLDYVDKEELGIYSASMNEKTIKRYTLATIGSIYRKPELFSHFGIFILDECFIAGTKIDDKNIEDIKIGDYVDSFNHLKNKIEKKKVLAISKRWHKGMLTDINNGLIISTPNHPYYVKGKGYLSANKLKKGDIIYAKTISKRKNNIHLFNLWKKIRNKIILYKTQTTFWERFILPKMQNDKNDKYGYKSKNREAIEYSTQKRYIKYSEKNRTQTTNTRRERERNDNTRNNINGSTWRRMVALCSSHIKTSKRRIPTSLQNRFSKSNTQNSNRNRWWFSQFIDKKNTRRKERTTLKELRVDSIKILEQTSNGRFTNGKKYDYVYNLQVEDNNNYFANGILVHNCHLLNPNSLTGMFTKFIKKVNEIRIREGKLPIKVTGMTATPFRLSTKYIASNNGWYKAITTIKLINRMKGFFWQRILFNIGISELQEMGYLCPLQYTDVSLIEHEDIPLNKSESDFDLDAYEEKISDRQKKILETISYAESISKAVLVFCSSVRQATKLSEIVGNSAIITAITPKKEREEIVNSFRNGEIKIMFNVGVLTVGFDFPALDCIILLRPSKSIGLYVQMVGRGLRVYPGKKSCHVIDMTSTVKSLGRVETIRIEKINGKWELLSETGSWHDRDLYSFKFQKS